MGAFTLQEYIGGPASKPLWSLLDIVRSEGVWDLIDLDCQGAELAIIRKELVHLTPRVRMMHISTHSRDIHHEILGLLLETSWAVQVEFACHSAPRFEKFGSFVA